MEINLPQRKWYNTIPYGIFALLLAFTLISPNSYATDTFVLGNKISPAVGPGPTGDGLTNIRYPGSTTVVFSRTSSLAPANVKINWNDSHGSSTENHSLYCTRAETGTGGMLSIESGFVSAGSYGGLDIFKTNITGLYFSINIRSFSTYYQATANVSNLDIKDGVMHSALQLTGTSSSDCYMTNETGEVNYVTRGGLGFYSTITFYTDQTYTPGSSSVSLLKTGGYHLRIWNENPGSGIHSYYLNVNYDISNVIINEPTCSTQPVASGSSVSGTTVDLGSYSPNDIINGATAIPFAIKLAGCRGLRNINVTLTTTAPSSSATMLGNSLTANKATGVGVEISGAKNSYSPQMILIPNDTTSVYNDQRDTTSDDNIYGNGQSGVTQSQTLNFLATLKRDNNQKIGSGNFKATGIFTFDYP